MGGDLRSKYNPTLPNIGKLCNGRLQMQGRKYVSIGAALELLGAAGDLI